MRGELKMKKVLTFLMAMSVAVSMLSGCGSEQADTKNKKSETKTIANADDLAGAKIGVQLGTTGDIFVSEEYESQGSTIERYSKGADAIVALNSGKIDAVVIDSEPAKAFVAKNSGLKILDDPFVEEEYAIAVAKENTELKDKINAALKTLKENGTLDAITANYIGDDTKGKTPYVSPENTARSNGKLIMATNAAFEPYEYIENDKIVGIDVDMAQAVCDILGMELEVEDIEFDSIITEVQTGKADIGAAGMTVTEDRLKNIDFTDSYTTATQVIIVKK